MRIACRWGTREDRAMSPRIPDEEPAIATPRDERNRLCGVAKRMGDVLTSLAGLILLSPVLVAVALHIKRTSPGPVFYRGPRMGRFGKKFLILKFRTMQDCPEGEDGPRVTAADDPRVTPDGHWLRDTKLNELPQLWNVLKGEMSLVGPRPEDPEVVATWPDAARQEILSIRPGITSPASIVFRDEERMLKADSVMRNYLSTIVPSKIRLDEIYVRDHSLLGDLDVIFMTAIALIPSLRDRSIPEDLLLWGPLSRFVSRHLNWFLLDVPIAFAAVGVSAALWRTGGSLNVGFGPAVLVAVGIGLLFGISNAVLGMDRITWSHARPSDALGLAISNAVTTASLILVDRFLVLHWQFPLGLWVMTGILTFTGFVVARYRLRLLTGLATHWLQWRGTGTRVGERVLIVGAGEMAQFTAQVLRRNGYQKLFSIVGMVDDDPKKLGSSVAGCKVVGTTRDLARLVERRQIGAVLFSIGNILPQQRDALVARCQHPGVRLVLVPGILGMVSTCLVAPQAHPDRDLVFADPNGKVPARAVIDYLVELEALARPDNRPLISRLRQVRNALAASLTNGQT